jgi:hypothetical protein
MLRIKIRKRKILVEVELIRKKKISKQKLSKFERNAYFHIW